MIATSSFALRSAPPRLATPCIASDEREHCIAGLLHGVACCPDGTCAICEAQEGRMRRGGHHELDVARAWVRGRVGRLDGCPACGFPPPPPLDTIPPLPRLDRSDRLLAGASRCRYCDRKILGTRRRYCGRECWNAYTLWARRMQREVART